VKASSSFLHSMVVLDRLCSFVYILHAVLNGMNTFPGKSLSWRCFPENVFRKTNFPGNIRKLTKDYRRAFPRKSYSRKDVSQRDLSWNVM